MCVVFCIFAVTAPLCDLVVGPASSFEFTIDMFLVVDTDFLHLSNLYYLPMDFPPIEPGTLTG